MVEIFDIVVKVVPLVVAFSVALLATIAPLTQSDLDNKALTVLRWIEDRILTSVFPSLRNVKIEKEDDEPSDGSQT